MKVTIVPIVIGTLGTETKGLLKGLEDLEVGGRVETIQTTALLKTWLRKGNFKRETGSLQIAAPKRNENQSYQSENR